MIITEVKEYKDHRTHYICCEVIYDSEMYLVMYSDNSKKIDVEFADSGYKNWRKCNRSNAIEKKISKLIKEKYS